MTPHSSIAHYRITAKLGEGGMGEVWRATDTKLGRDVAIKVLPDTFAADPDRMARFEREAKVLASLNHPNIAAIYGVEERALVMELVEGPTLAERIAQGPVPPEEALPIVNQLVDALEYAHDKGVVHRDLKPANIKVTPEGRVKVLDFGLAKALSSESSAVDPASSPTLTMRATLAGVIMGTAAYMAPEQARGHDADRRADIWAFGVVVYEMLTGRRLFEGPTVSDTLAAVLTKEPELEAVPARMRRLLQVCLVKDPRRRLSHISGARLLLEETPATAAAPRRSGIPWAIAAAVLAISLVVTGALLWRGTRPADRQLLQFSVDLGPDAVTGLGTTAILSPDGGRLVFPSRGADGKPQLSIRQLNQPKATILASSENGQNPFFSPDGQWIGFVALGKLKKLPVTGGAAVTLYDPPMATAVASGAVVGASWGEDGNIILGRGVGGLLRLPEAGGTPLPLTKPSDKGEITHRWPQILPGGQAVLFTAHTSPVDFDNASIAVLSLKTGQWKTVHRGGYFGRYLPSGHLIYIHEGAMLGVRFDPVRGEVQGVPVPLLEDVAANSGPAGGQFDFSQTGTLVYLSGKLSVRDRPIVGIEKGAGKIQSLLAPSDCVAPRLSPDSKRLAVACGGPSGSDISVYDIQRETMTKITFNSQRNNRPVWAPDGKHIAYYSIGTAGSTLWWARADGAGEPQRLLESKDLLFPYSFSTDGTRLSYATMSPESLGDIWTLPLDFSDPEHPKPGKSEPFLRTPANELNPAFSPDGKWMAYQSDESRNFEVYVRPFPGPGGKWLVSSGGGFVPVWSRDGRELLYSSPDGHIMAAAYRAQGDSFVWDKGRQWSDQQVAVTTVLPTYDLSPDGKLVVALLVAPREETKSPVHVTFLLNFFDELRRRMPPK